MIEIQDTFLGSEDAEIEMMKASRGKGMRRGFPLSHSHLTRGSGESRKLS